MIKKQDFIIHERPVTAPGATNSAQKSLPLTDGVWQHEALDTMKMYGPGEGKFSPVKGEQLTLFDLGPVTKGKEVGKLDLDDPSLKVPHQDGFRFFSKDTQRQQRSRAFYIAAQEMAPSQHTDAVSATQGKLLVDGVTELKEDQFPGRVHYTEGGLYTADPTRKKNQKVSAALVEEHRHAPNFRRMDKKPISGVGQPTKKGFADVLNHLKAQPKGDKPGKPVVWTNTRAEAVVYIEGTPYNLREMASRENLVLKDGASGADVEALESKLKQALIDKAGANGGKVRVPLEEAGPNGEKFKEVSVTPENVQTTKEVIDELKAPPNNYNVEYKRVPLADEKAPTPAQLDEIRSWMSDVQSRHPKDKDKLEYVFNCHQGRGRTTTGMVAGAIALDGKEGRTTQLELPLGITLGENAHQRGDRIIDEAFHMQNLRETVDETKKKAGNAKADAKRYEDKAAASKTEQERLDNEKAAKSAHEAAEKYKGNAADFTKRYALMQMYSEYVDKHGAHSKTMSFDAWMKEGAQCENLDKKWVTLSQALGIDQWNPLQPGGRADVALA